MLTWQTRDVDSISINNGVGTVTPTVGGSVTVNPTGTTTYIATVTGGAQSTNCRVTITLQTTPPPPPQDNDARCIDLSVNKSRIERGEEVVLSWRTDNARTISIDQGIGNVTPVAAGSVTVRPTRDTTYTATVTGARNSVNCQATVRMDDDNGGGGGGGGGSRPRPRVFIDSVTRPAEAPLASVYLSEIPYTGLDLGPAGTVVYWLMLILWSVAAAYLVLFSLVPALFRRSATTSAGNEGGHLPGWGPSMPAAAPAPAVHEAAHAAAVVSTLAPSRPAVRTAAPAPAPAAPVHSAYDGFRSFGDKGSLTIDDIVKGLSRESGMVFAQSKQEEQPAPAAHTPNVEEIHPEPIRAAAPAAAPAPAELHYADDVIDFLESLLEGDRDRVFGMVRSITKQGGDSQHFVSQAVCALDDAYRARVEGSDVHPEVARVTADCHTSFLERLVASLATAVDASYSAGITNTKLALTRALAIVNG